MGKTSEPAKETGKGHLVSEQNARTGWDPGCPQKVVFQERQGSALSDAAERPRKMWWGEHEWITGFLNEIKSSGESLG